MSYLPDDTQMGDYIAIERVLCLCPNPACRGIFVHSISGRFSGTITFYGRAVDAVEIVDWLLCPYCQVRLESPFLFDRLMTKQRVPGAPLNFEWVN